MTTHAQTREGYNRTERNRTEQNRTEQKRREEKKWEEDKLLFYVVVLIKIVTNERWRKR